MTKFILTNAIKTNNMQNAKLFSLSVLSLLSPSDLNQIFRTEMPKCNAYFLLLGVLKLSIPAVEF